ncbi:MAG: OmpA family protein [Bacteroidota bacterium]|nr:OmpA family protein [Bacteroidota bacterium]MDX5430626.1 OmpA family protein [Bacteroidota bacterium]MDX5469376.1 OmpA family protein [Bacteroidota bacterium]
MQGIKNPGTWLLAFFLVLSSCAVSQPSSKTDTKNKKAREFFMQALQYYNFRQTDEALQAIDKALNKDSKYLDALMLKGDILKTLKRYEESQQTFDAILAITDDLPEVYLYMGEMQFAAGWYEKSKNSLETFLASKPRDSKKELAENLLANANFAFTAVQNPVPFDPQNMGDHINSKNSEYFPGITADGEFFIYTRRLDGQMPQEDFYISRLQADGSWGPSYNLGPPVNTAENEGSVSISTDGQFIFFAACNRARKNTLQGREGLGNPMDFYPGCDLYFSRLEGDKWSIPRHLGNVVNSREWESTPSLSFDGLTVYFASTRPGGFGGSDIWKAQWEGSGFGMPINLGPTINTPGNEQTPFIHPDNQTLYFSSNGRPGMGGFDFYYSRTNDSGNWQEPMNLGYPINTSGDEKGLLVNRSGTLAYFSSDDRPEGKGGVDIYQFELYPEARPQVLSYVKAIVVDDETGEPLAATAELLSLETGSTVLKTSTNAKTGSFLIVLKANSDYALNVAKEGYLFHSENFALKQSAETDPFIIEVRLKKLKVDEHVVLNNVFFDVDKYDLKSESRVELDKLVDFMNANPSLKIEIGGHTDNTGNPGANQKLSEDRARSVYAYLVEKGINANRLRFKGYGANKPIATNDSEEGRKKNRRTEYRIIGL